jgi:hypothetical protein
MALTTSVTDDRFSDILILESGLGNTAVADLAGKAASIYSIDINNPSGGLAHVKFYDSTSGAASDIPVIILMVVAGDRRVFTMPDGIAFTNAITMRCVVEPGTGGTTSPSGGSGTVAVSLVMS